MPKPPAIVAWLWAAFVLYWLSLALFNKRVSRRTPVWSGWGVRAAIIVGALVFVRFRRETAGGLAAAAGHFVPLRPGAPGQWLGVGLCLAGFAFAFWARACLGRNWGMPMSLRQGHELVTSGPYACVRHPIYSGIMLAMIGSALAVAITWLALFVLYFAYFLFSARTEEKMMLAQFPDAYPAYRRRTKMLVPFLF